MVELFTTVHIIYLFPVAHEDTKATILVMTYTSNDICFKITRVLWTLSQLWVTF